MKLLDDFFGDTALPVPHQEDTRLRAFGKKLNHQFARGNVLLQQGRVITRADVKERLRALHVRFLAR